MARRHQPTDALVMLNATNQLAQLDALIDSYFRTAAPPKTASSKRRKRPHSALEAGHGDDTVHATPDTTLPRLKQFLKESKDPSHIQRVFDAVERQLSRAKRQKPLLPLILTLCSELFARSAAFRTLVTKQIGMFANRLLEAAGETNLVSKRRSAQQHTVKQSDAVVAVLGMLERWRDEFGPKYPTVVACYDGLVDMGYQFPCVVARQAEREARVEAEQAQRAALHEIKLKKVINEMTQIQPEMEVTIAEMNNIFEILVPTLEAFEMPEIEDETVGPLQGVSTPKTEEEDDEDGVEWEGARPSPVAIQDDDDSDGDDIEWEDVNKSNASNDEDDHPHEGMDINEIVRAYGLGSSSYQLTISIPTTVCEQSSENEALFTNLLDGVLQIRKQFLPLVRDWLQVANTDAAAVGAARDAALVPQLQDLLTRLERATLKWEDLVKESDRKRFARVQPRVVSLPLAAFHL